MFRIRRAVSIIHFLSYFFKEHGRVSMGMNPTLLFVAQWFLIFLAFALHPPPMYGLPHIPASWVFQ